MTIDTQRLRQLAQSFVTQGAPKWEIEWAANEIDRLRAIEAAPQSPKLSDERILEIWASNSGRPVTMGKARIIAQARAIEREILGGGHE